MRLEQFNQQLRQALVHDSFPAVSLLMPTHRGGSETRADPIQLKNLLADARERLKANNTKKGDALLAAADALVDDNAYWQHQRDGLAIYLADGQDLRVTAGWSLQPRAMVGRRFHVRDLVPPFGHVGRIHLLALSQKTPKLFRIDGEYCTEVPVDDMPDSLAQALLADKEKSLQFHSSMSPQTPVGDRRQMYHGQGAAGDDASERQEVFELCRQVDDALHEFLGESQAPLVISAVEWVASVYREANTYPHFIDAPIVPNAENVDDKRLIAEAREAARKWFDKPRRQAMKTFDDAQGSEQTVRDIRKLVADARNGKVQTLWLRDVEPIWGRPAAMLEDVDVHETYAPGDEDLLNVAMIDTVTQSGEVFALKEDELSDVQHAAAILRY